MDNIASGIAQKVQVLEKVSVLGTGKTNYTQLRRLVAHD
jgi:hypothetical protein